ncbi:hypothetical protein BS47DRAFT_1213716 [Hydnum rufescens UP504]|uniref:Uncharacterized protein n=1 Tax=Hydnum rufescens UP504 TaxID=1448309 RepID=A0A9P6ARZ7_9AGAM|nr:hypothetical protein BS47DRAFT_1213716 [Hydnum rufescens UP504]
MRRYKLWSFKRSKLDKETKTRRYYTKRKRREPKQRGHAIGRPSASCCLVFDFAKMTSSIYGMHFGIFLGVKRLPQAPGRHRWRPISDAPNVSESARVTWIVGTSPPLPRSPHVN